MASWKKIITQDSNGVVSVSTKLGVGTSSPSKNLHISGSGEQNAFLQSSNGNARVQLEGTTFADIIMTDTGGGSNAKKIQIRQGDDSFKIRTLTDAGDVNNEVIHLDIPNNRVGIGTTSPRGKLDVLGSWGSQGFYVSSYGGAVYLPTDIAHSGGAGTFDIQVRNYRLGTTSGGNISIYPKHGTNSLGLGTASYQNKFFINGSNGNIGIGNTSPSHPLHVDGNLFLGRISANSTNSILFHPGSGGSYPYMDVDSSGRFDIKIDGTNAMSFSENGGGIGIGVTNPSEKLEIGVTDNNTAFSFYRATVADNNWLGKIEFKGNNGTETHTYSQIHSVCTNFEDGAEYSDVKISTSNGSNGLEEVAQFYQRKLLLSHSSSRLGIGTNNPAYGLDVRSTGYFATASTVDQLRLGDLTNGKQSSIRSVNDTMQFKPDGSNVRFFIGNTGKVGVNTSSPTHMLHVKGSGNTNQSLFLATDSDNNNQFRIDTSSADGSPHMRLYDTSGSSTVVFSSNGASKIMGGNLGIGTDSADTLLHIKGTSPHIKTEVSSGTNFSGIEFFDNNSTSSGKVGTFGHTGGTLYIQQSANTAMFSDAGITFTRDLKIQNQAPFVTFDDTQGGVLQLQSNAGDIRIRQNSTGDSPTTDTIYVTNAGKVGIGRSASTPPVASLEVYKNTTTNNDKLFRIYNGNGLQWEIEGDGTMSGYVGNNIAGVLQIKGTWQTDLAVAGGDANSEASAGNVVFKTNNTERARITNTGRLGIGLTSPVTPLHVHSATTGSNFIHVTNNTSGGGANDGMEFGLNGAHGYVWNRENASLYFGTNDTTRMTITSDGKVGINDTSPASALHVEKIGSNSPILFNDGYYGYALGSGNLPSDIDPNSNSFRMYMSSTRLHMVTTHGSGQFRWLNGGSNRRMTLDNNGRLGIGLSVDPNKPLHVEYTDAEGTIAMLRGGAFSSVEDRPVGVTYSHSVSGNHYSWYAGTMYDNSTNDGYNGRRFTIGVKVADGHHADLTNDAHSVMWLGQSDSSANFNGKVWIGNTHNNGQTFNSMSTKGNELILDGGANSGMTIVTDNDEAGYITHNNYNDGDYQQIKFDAANAGMFFKAGGTDNVLALKSTGVGIGTASPSHKLHVKGAGNTNQNLFLITDSDDNNQFRVDNSSADGSPHMRLYDTSGASKVVFSSNGNSKIMGGNVGIGTDSPSTKLHVASGAIRLDSSQQLQLGGSSTHIDGDSGHMSFDVNSGKRFKLDGNSRISLSNNDAGTQNTVFGSTAGNALVSGSQGNSSLGHESMLNTTTGDRNTAIGYQSLRHNVTGGENVAVGYEALRGSSGNSTSNNIAVGNYVMYGLATGFSNIGIGNQALYHNNTGTKNIAIGQNAMIGTASTAQIGNVVIGYEAMKNPTTANYNVFVGTESGHLTTTGDNNVGVGYRTLSSLTQGGSNVALGNRTFSGLTTGDDNIGIGSDAGSNITTGSYNILMGDHNPGTSGMNNHTILGQPDTNRHSIFGRVALHSQSSDYATISHYDQMYSGVNYALRQASDGTTDVNSADGKTINFNINNSTRGVFKGNNFGVGTTNPTAKLQAHNGAGDYTNDLLYLQGGNGDRKFRINPGAGGLRIGHVGNSSWSIDTDGYENIRFTKTSDMKFFANNSEKMRLLASGNLGIGETSPTTKLDVGGTFRASGNSQFGGNLDVTGNLVIDGDLEVSTESHFYDSIYLNGSNLDVSQSTVTGLNVSVVPTKTVVLQSSALNGYQDANDSTEDLYWSTMSTHNTSHITWSAGQGGYYFQFVTAGEYMIYCTLAVTDSASNDRLNFLAYVTHMSGSNQPIYSYGIGGAYIRDDNSPYDSGGLGGGIRLIVSAGERVKINTELLDTETQTGSAYFNTTKSKIRIEKITYSTT